MAQSRFYSSTAVPTIVVGDITPSQTSVVLQVVTGLPASTPFILALGYNTGSEELVLVNGQAGTTLSPIVRGYDGTSATAHLTGAPVRHVWAGIDGNDSRAHEGSSTNVHGLAGGAAVVGTTSTQTLTNKTLTSPAINTPTVTTPTVTGGTFTGGTFVNPAVQEAAVTANAVGDVPLSVTAFPASVVDAVNVKNSSAVDVFTVGPTGAVTAKPSATAVSPIIANGPTGTSVSIFKAQLNGVDKFTVGSTGITHNFAGERAGSADQFAIDTAGAVSSTAMASSFVENTTSVATSSTTFTATGTVVQTTIVVPPSGKVFVSGWSGSFTNANGVNMFSVIVSTGSTSGTLRAATDANATQYNGGNASNNGNGNGSQSFILTGVAGETITLQWQHRVSSNSGATGGRNISAFPLLG